MKEKNTPPIRPILRKLAIEMLIYGILLIGYFLVVLRYLAEPLANYFDSNLTTYAFIGLGLIIAQSVLLDYIVAFLIKLLGLGHVE
ncbi:MAG: hypothetical protein N2C13_02720 [Chloroflexota bacterium]